MCPGVPVPSYATGERERGREREGGREEREKERL
jgi:hypothetical protein